jgi:small subunit ribosomal protein S20
VDVANTKSAEKRARQNAVRRARNQSIRTQVKSAVKHAREAFAGKDAAASQQALRDAMKMLSGAASKGVLHPRNAARRISRLAHSLATAQPPKAKRT